MDEKIIGKILLNGNPGGSGSTGKPRAKWKEQVKKNLKLRVLGAINYKRKGPTETNSQK